MEVTVKLNNIRRSPNKIRPVLFLVRNKPAENAVDILRFTNKACAVEIRKLIQSAIAASRDKEMDQDALFVKDIRCDGAGMYKRHRFGSRGRVVRILKRNSHLTLTLSDQAKSNKDDKSVKNKPVAKTKS